jgi:hypothetical protein
VTSVEIQQQVDESMRLALENGYEQFLRLESLPSLAVDMADNDSTIENLVAMEFDGEADLLIPYIDLWRKRNLA